VQEGLVAQATPTAPGEAVAVAAGVDMVMVVAREAEAVGLRRPMNATVVGSWATGPENAGPNLNRTRPTLSRRRRPH
jgi:hypothetical protein